MELPEIQKAIEALPAVRRRELLDWLNAETTKAGETKEGGAATPVQKNPPAPRPGKLSHAVLWTALSVAAFFLADAAIFRSGWYLNYLQPDSTTGQLELHLFWVRHTLPAKVPEAAVVGDSRIAEGFAARVAGAAVGDRFQFWNMGVPGSSPRTWYYLLRDSDPGQKRFAAIAIAIDRFSDEDHGENPSDRLSDLNYVVGRLRLIDCLDFSQSYSSPQLRRGVLTGCLFKAVPLRRDIQDLFSNGKERLKLARAWRNDGHGYIDGYLGKPESLTGLTADFEKRTISFPPDLKDWQRDSVRDFVMARSVPQTGALTAYRKLWLGRILDLYKDSKTKIIFFELPGGPLPPPPSTVPARFIDSVWRRPRLTVLPGEMFRDLEHPEVYADGLHLNRVGRPIFSERLGQKIVDVLGVR